MPVPSSGQIKISEIATEFSDTAPYQMSEYYRGGGFIPDVAGNASIPTSGQIGLGNMYGAINRASVALNITANTQNYDVGANAIPSPSYVAGNTDVTVTISPGVYVGSSSVPAYAMSVPNSFNPADTVTIVNNGLIIGRGGNGGAGYNGPAQGRPGLPGGAGGKGLYVNFPTTITNNGTIAGGGGGGGGSGGGGLYGSGGGGGGGAGYPGGSGGAPGPYGTPGVSGPGAAGTATAGGAGGFGNPGGGYGGTGGGQGANGSAGAGGYYAPAGGGGTRGHYLVGNPLVTFPATGTLLGQVS